MRPLSSGKTWKIFLFFFFYFVMRDGILPVTTQVIMYLLCPPWSYVNRKIVPFSQLGGTAEWMTVKWIWLSYLVFPKHKEICYPQSNLFQMWTLRLIDSSKTIIIHTSDVFSKRLAVMNIQCQLLNLLFQPLSANHASSRLPQQTKRRWA